MPIHWHWVFFIPNVINQPLSFDYENYGLLNHYFNNYLSRKYLRSSKSRYPPLGQPFHYYKRSWTLSLQGRFKIFIILTCTRLQIKNYYLEFVAPLALCQTFGIALNQSHHQTPSFFACILIKREYNLFLLITYPTLLTFHSRIINPETKLVLP